MGSETRRGCLGLVAGLMALGLMGTPAEAGWSAGAARVDITPEGPVWMAGYAARKAPSEGFAHPIHAKALALRDDAGSTVLWITADLIGFDRELTQAIARRVEEAHGIPRKAVALFASHTHTGPLVKYVPETLAAYGIDPESPAARNNRAFRRALEEKLVTLAGEALANLKPATARYGVGSAGFAINRREKTATGFKIGLNPDGPTDHSVPVLRVTGADGKELAIVFGYACHNTTLGADERHLTGDYAGFAQSAIEAEHPGAVALFVTGCAGDANPNPRGTRDLARTHGRSLADAVESALAGADLALEGRLRSAMAEPSIRFAGPTDRAAYEARLGEPGSGRQAHARRMLAELDAGRPIRTEHPYAIQAFALGDRLTMVALAGEVVVDYALRLRKELAAEGRPVWVAAYANDVFGYVGSARVILEGGYEGGESYFYSTFPTPLEEGVEEQIVGTVHDLFRAVHTQP